MKPEENKSSNDVWDILIDRKGIACTDEYKTVFGQLEKGLNDSLVDRIKYIEKRCILLIGSDKDLIRKLACLIYYYSDTLGFHHVDCLNERNIDDKLTQFKRGTVFLEDIDGKDLPLIKRIDTKIAGFLNAGLGLPYTFNGIEKTTPQGQLIISASDADNLPQYFTSKFNIIPLEPAKKDLPAGTPESIPEDTSSYLLNNTNYLHIGRTPIKLAPSHADFLRFMVNESKGSFLELQYILTYHYGIETMNKMTLSKDERRPFDKEANKINTQCKKALQKDLIKSLGDKKYTLSINIKLPKNSPKDSP